MLRGLVNKFSAITFFNFSEKGLERTYKTLTNNANTDLHTQFYQMKQY